MHSVIIPAFNAARFLAECLASALAQLGPDDEVIVVDNGSTDATPDIVERLSSDRRVRLLHEAKRGPAAARNTGLRRSRGDFISFLDADDYWPPGRQAGMMQVLDGAPEADAVYGRMTVIFDDAPVEAIAKERMLYGPLDGIHAPLTGLWNYIFRREILERVGTQNEAMMLGEDVDYLLRLQTAGMRCVVYDGPAIVYRRHGMNMTQDKKGILSANMSIVARHLRRKRGLE